MVAHIKWVLVVPIISKYIPHRSCAYKIYLCFKAFLVSADQSIIKNRSEKSVFANYTKPIEEAVKMSQTRQPICSNMSLTYRILFIFSFSSFFSYILLWVNERRYKKKQFRNEHLRYKRIDRYLSKSSNCSVRYFNLTMVHTTADVSFFFCPFSPVILSLMPMSELNFGFHASRNSFYFFFFLEMTICTTRHKLQLCVCVVLTCCGHDIFFFFISLPSPVTLLYLFNHFHLWKTEKTGITVAWPRVPISNVCIKFY